MGSTDCFCFIDLANVFANCNERISENYAIHQLRQNKWLFPSDFSSALFECKSVVFMKWLMFRPNKPYFRESNNQTDFLKMDGKIKLKGGLC